ncbi:Ppx/GppA family phosphatase [Candidatus Poribacteria bacterium]|nr:Ppx/GppA family phosphatase [Candidatus Poribacteria bacterium]MBT5535727.1 Ppx/GppA family phosphatase [Candidatus Poribacteria bacterium]MBT5711276.1 Ppx/GppA family phosphatase [Candidatus Poribacteria bacterium]MBT7809320.1 Ppx/GppA family phosphatase [Candidatus Poribacteria bacterium]
MRLAAIDTGTNSIHTVIVEVGDDLTITIVDSTKDTAQLGRGRDSQGRLSARAMTDALAAFRKAFALCKRHRVERILAVATSAIREAPNGVEFLRVAAKQTGIDVRVISGPEEARLIYLAVRESVHLHGKPFLCVDIGGGSVEFIWGTREELLHADSLKLGSLRLAGDFELSDPATKSELRQIRRYAAEQMTQLDAPTADIAAEVMVGTSGTIHQLCRLALGDAPALLSTNSLHQQAVSADSLRDVCRKLARSTVKERTAMRLLDRPRLYSIVPGALLYHAILERYDVEEVLVCEYALREGVLYDYVERNRVGLRQEQILPDVRRRSVLALARRCEWQEAHGRHVAALSLMLFDQLGPHFAWDPSERDLLEYAAFLHDIGMHISVQLHHRHSQYLIEHGELLGFTPREVAIMANAARYHRTQGPKKKHAGYGALAKKDRAIVDRFAGILQVAESFDRTQFQLIRSLHCEVDDAGISVLALADGDAAVELSVAAERTGLLSEATGRPVRVQLAAAELFAEGLLGADTVGDASAADTQDSSVRKVG